MRRGTSTDIADTVSVVLPVYNGERYLRESVDSILLQGDCLRELVIVNDGSTDGTAGILDEYAAHPKVQVVKLARNRGLPTGLNIGFAATSGPYLTWTSDDNRYKPNALGTMASALSVGRADLVYAMTEWIDGDGQVVSEFVTDPPRCLPKWNVVHACFMYTRTVYDAIGGYRDDYRLAEDYDYWMRAYQRFRFARIDKVLYQYRSHGDSLTASEGHKVDTVLNRVRGDFYRDWRRWRPHVFVEQLRRWVEEKTLHPRLRPLFHPNRVTISRGGPNR